MSCRSLCGPIPCRTLRLPAEMIIRGESESDIFGRVIGRVVVVDQLGQVELLYHTCRLSVMAE
jgi:hypothetical protein